MLAMTGTLEFGSASVVDELARRLRGYQSVRVSERQRVVQIPPIGSFLVDWDTTAARLHVVANRQRDLDEIIEQLDAEVVKGSRELVAISWAPSSAVPVPLR